MNELLEAIVNTIDRGDAPDSKFPDRRGEYWALCPFHPDTHATNFSFNEERGYKCFSCGAEGSLEKLAQKLGVECTSSREQTYSPTPLTLEAYSEAKALEVAFLESLGLRTVHLQGKAALKMPYYSREGDEVAVRFRLALGGESRFRWRRNSQIHPYGLWKLSEAREVGYVFLVEGESDCQTLWSYGLPALGIPGATTWRSSWAEHLEGLEVFVWQEPDGGGAEFVKRIGECLPGAWVIPAPDGRKDFSECHVLGDDVPTLAQELRNRAIPYVHIRSEANREAAAEAEREAAALLACPDILSEFVKLCEELGLVGEQVNAKLLYLALTSRLLDTPVSIVVKGPSSAGKSFTANTVLSAFPDSAYYVLSSMSERALAYSEEPLQHRILVVYEMSGIASDFGSYLVRSLLSEGHIRYETVEKTADGLKPKLIEREGPTGLLTTTTWAKLHSENETRMLSLTVCDTKQQTQAVMEALAKQACNESQPQPDLAPWHALQTWLELAGVREVVIPYAKKLAEGANPLAVRLRRDFGVVLNLIRAHAILHQKRRERDNGRVVATLEDYGVVYDLVQEVLSEGVQATVKPQIRETVGAVKELYGAGSEPVSVAAVARYLHLDQSSVRRRVWVAITNGYLVNEETRKGRPLKLIPGEPLPADQPILPHPNDLGTNGQGRVWLVYDPSPHTRRENLTDLAFGDDAIGEDEIIINGERVPF